MKDETRKLIEMIQDNKSLNEISSVLGLSNKQLFVKLSMLRNSGYLLDRTYTYDGQIKYFFSSPFNISKANVVNVEAPDDLTKLRVLLTSDTHLGNINDEIRCINSMFDYCAKNNINIIFNAGDFFEGIVSGGQRRHSSIEEQISYGLKEYPYDKNILTLTVLGNHDASIWKDKGIDIKTILLDRRHDIIPVGYGLGEVYIGRVPFRMSHPVGVDNLETGCKVTAINKKVFLKGHSHRFSVSTGNDSISICIPSLSSVSTFGSTGLPGMVDMRLYIKNNNICTEYLQQFIFIDNKPIRVSEINYRTLIPLAESTKKQSNESTNLNDKSLQNTGQVEDQNMNNIVNVNNDFSDISQIEKNNSRDGIKDLKAKVNVKRK